MKTKDQIFNKDSFIFKFRKVYELKGYNTYSIEIQINEFVGRGEFVISKSVTQDIISKLTKIQSQLKGICIINDYDSDSYIRIEFTKYGQLKINGQIGGSHKKNYLVFHEYADQTLINNLLNVFVKD